MTALQDDPRGMVAERFLLARDFNLELGMPKEVEEFVDFFGPFCEGSRKADLVSSGKSFCGWVLWKSWCAVWLLIKRCVHTGGM